MRAALRDPEVVHRRRWLILLVLCVSLIVILLDNTILNVALPRLASPTSQGGLDASQSELQWIVDSYTIVFAGLLLTAGSMGDRYGRYRSLVIGLAVFGVGSILSAVATDASFLIGTRALMGIGGAFIMPSTLSILTNVFTDHDERRKAIGIWAGVSALGLGVGPVTGGFLLEHFWWGAIFLVNLPVVVAGLVLGYMLVPESRDERAPRLDPGGAVLSIVGLTVLLWGVIEAPSKGWTSGPVLAAFVVGLALIAGFFTWEARSTHPMLDLQFFRNPRFSVASAAITLTFLCLFGLVFLLTQYLQLVLGYSTIKAGALLLPQSALMMVMAPLSSVWVRRFGNKVVVSAGLAIVGVAMLLLGTLDVGSNALHVVGVTLVLGLGMANTMAPATDSIMGSLPPWKAGVGSAVNDTTRQVGGAVGVAVFGSLLASRYSAEVRDLLGDAVPAPVLGQVADSIGRAFQVAGEQGGATAAQILAASREGYVHGLHVTAVVAGIIMLVASAGVLRFLPARHRAEAPVRPEVADPGVDPVDGLPDLARDGL